MEMIFRGKIEFSKYNGITLKNPEFEMLSSSPQHLGRLTPVYPETEGLTSKFIRSKLEPLLILADYIDDPVPADVANQYNLMPLNEALKQIHFPDDDISLEKAKERIAFEEIFLLQVAAQRARRRRLAGVGAVIPYEVENAKEFAASLPFNLTEGQRRACHEIFKEMAGPGPMNRLLQADVGAGKTACGAMAMHMAAKAGYQSMLMAPTEILARQHHATLDKMLSPHGWSVRLLVGSTPAKVRREILAGLMAGTDHVLVGTHALIEDVVQLDNLGLVIVDEQHRFGVAQRQKLRQKAKTMPNFLSMTATPIPRSMALTMYGDVSLSEIREMPVGRIPIETRVVPPHLRDKSYQFIRQQVQAGRQVFVICPLIEENDKLGIKSVTQEYEKLKTLVFPDLRMEFLHGKMPAKEKQERMAIFAKHEADVIVSTSVVEVGVDVPNATVMMIEGAERFGLAQLHQFRGRVGRSQYLSYCLLFQSDVDAEESRRLRAVADTASGFDLAEIDLRLRGPGDVIGQRQSGIPEIKTANLLDEKLLRKVQVAASDWLDVDPELNKNPALNRAMNGYRGVFDLD